MRRTILKLIVAILMVLLLTGCKSKSTVDQFAKPGKNETVAEIVIKDFGSIHVKFFQEAAPKAVENFTTHAKEGYYDGLTFHRIIEDFMIQGGDPTGTGKGGESIWGKDFDDEFSADLQPYRGALCMANSGPDTNGSQFFLVQTTQTYDKNILSQLEQAYGIKYNNKAVETYATTGGTPWLYKAHTVFGQVFDGYEVLDAVAKVEKADAEDGIPSVPVVIDTIRIYEYTGE